MSTEHVQGIDAVVARLHDVGDRIGARFTAEFERMKAADSPDIFDRRWGFVDKTGTVNFDRAPIKYAVHGRKHLKLKLRYLPHFVGLKSAYDIGVGSGQMYMLLRDAFNVAMTGLDATDVSGSYLYREFRRELGIEKHVDLREIQAGTDIRIPQNVEAILALWSVFDRGWGRAEHDWFVNLCRAKGAKRLIWRFNMAEIQEETLSYYERAGAHYPWPNDRGFCFLEL